MGRVPSPSLSPTDAPPGAAAGPGDAGTGSHTSGAEVAEVIKKTPRPHVFCGFVDLHPRLTLLIGKKFLPE